MEGTNVLFSIGPVQITSTLTTMWAIILILTILSILATRKLKDVPGPLQNLAEMAVEGLQKYFAGIMGAKAAKKYFPILATYFIFIVVCNYAGLLPGAGHFKGFAVPTACLSVTAALAIVAFFTTHTIGIREVGAKRYFKAFIMPYLIMLPLNLIEQAVRPVSLALRLYGNLYSEEMVVEQLYNIFPVLLPLLMNVLSLLFCFIQAMVSTMLLSIYVAEGIEEEH